MPPGCELDAWEGRCYVSLVALRMERVRIGGLAIPGLTAFPQVNLRFYLRHAGRAAVCFVHELVPHRLLAAGARWLYGEPFQAGCVRSRVAADGDAVTVEYRFGRDRADALLRVSSGPAGAAPPGDSFAHWVKERTRGCRTRSGRLVTFDVAHTPWAVRPVRDARLELRFAEGYGAEWSFLDSTPPASVLHAEGSDVTVSRQARAAAPAP